MPRDRSALMARMPPSISEITPHLFLGNASSSLHDAILRQNGITAVVSLLDAEYDKWNSPEYRKCIPRDRHLFVRCQDNLVMDLLAILPDICGFVDRQLGTPEADSVPGNVLIHCELGISRSPSVVIGYLMRKRRKGLDAILADVNRQRKVSPNESFLEQLGIWEAIEYEPWEDADKGNPKKEYRDYLETRGPKDV